MRIPLDGFNDEDLTIAATDVREVIKGADFDGDAKTFVLEELTLTNEHATTDGVIELWDQDEAVATAANQRLTVVVPANATVKQSYAKDAGPRFKTSICASATAGTFVAYSCHASGHME